VGLPNKTHWAVWVCAPGVLTQTHCHSWSSVAAVLFRDALIGDYWLIII